MAKWPTGNNLIEKLDIEGFRLFEFVTKGLQPHSPTTGRPIPPPNIKQKKLELQRLKKGLKILVLVRRRMDLPKLTEAFIYNKYPLLLPAVLVIERRRPQLEHIEKDIKETENKIDTLTTEISKAGHSWENYKLPEAKAVSIIDALKDYKYNPEDVAEVEKSVKPIKKKLRPVQEVKIKIQNKAKELWEETPSITIADMINHPQIVPFRKKKDGSFYTEKVVRNWIKVLCPNRQPGRRSGT